MHTNSHLQFHLLAFSNLINNGSRENLKLFNLQFGTPYLFSLGHQLVLIVKDMIFVLSDKWGLIMTKLQISLESRERPNYLSTPFFHILNLGTEFDGKVAKPCKDAVTDNRFNNCPIK